MIKLSFSGFKFLNNGMVSKGRIIATIKYCIKGEWDNIEIKEFKTKLTYKPGDKFDLNKAYKIIKAKLEKDAYEWAANEVQKVMNDNSKQYGYLKDFINKANNVTLHNHQYICDLLDIKL